MKILSINLLLSARFDTMKVNVEVGSLDTAKEQTVNYIVEKEFASSMKKVASCLFIISALPKEKVDIINNLLTIELKIILSRIRGDRTTYDDPEADMAKIRDLFGKTFLDALKYTIGSPESILYAKTRFDICADDLYKEATVMLKEHGTTPGGTENG